MAPWYDAEGAALVRAVEALTEGDAPLRAAVGKPADTPYGPGLIAPDAADSDHSGWIKPTFNTDEGAEGVDVYFAGGPDDAFLFEIYTSRSLASLGLYSDGADHGSVTIRAGESDAYLSIHGSAEQSQPLMRLDDAENRTIFYVGVDATQGAGVAGDFTINSGGVVLQDSNGNYHRLKVATDGTLSTEVVS